MIADSTRELLQDVLTHIGAEDEALPNISPAMLIAGAFHQNPLVGEYLAKDERNELRTRIRKELAEV
jgi:hypothetical protein